MAFKTAQFLIYKLKAEEFAYLRSSDFYYLSGSAVQDGILNLPELPYGKFYYWKNPFLKTDSTVYRKFARGGDLIIFLSNAQPDLVRSEEYCRRILSVVNHFNTKMVICFAAMPLPIDHKQKPQVWGTATGDKLKEILIKHNLKIMKEGQISGMNGLFLSRAKKEGLQGICLLGEIPIYTIQIENPKACYVLLNVLSKIVGLPLDIREIKQQADFIEGQINQLVDYLKLGAQQPPPIGEEEIEKIKKSLDQYTKLPDSVRVKIENLLKQSKRDISKANELKQELDKWNVYKEYEDRFLDLFKKPRDKGN